MALVINGYCCRFLWRANREWRAFWKICIFLVLANFCVSDLPLALIRRWVEEEEVRWDEMEADARKWSGCLGRIGGRGRKGEGGGRLIWVSRSHSCQGRAAAGGNFSSSCLPETSSPQPKILMEPQFNHLHLVNTQGQLIISGSLWSSSQRQRNWWMLANIIWQQFFSPNSLRHLQHQQEIGAKKRNRWENVAAVQEGRKLYFRPAPQKQKLKHILLHLKRVQMKFVSKKLPHVHFTFTFTIPPNGKLVQFSNGQISACAKESQNNGSMDFPFIKFLRVAFFGLWLFLQNKQCQSFIQKH